VTPGPSQRLFPEHPEGLFAQASQRAESSCIGVR
jgi:hypothetical protein